MKARRTPILVHLLGAALAAALLAFWGLRLAAPATPVAPAGMPAPLAPAPDAALAGRMFGDLGAAPVAGPLAVQVSGVFAAGRASSAVIAIDGKPARAVLLGQELVAGVRLVEVRAEGVVLEQGGARTQYFVPAAIVAKPSAAAATFRREGAVLTAPSIEGAAAGRSAAAPPNPPGGIPARPAPPVALPGPAGPPEPLRHLGPPPAEPGSPANGPG